MDMASLNDPLRTQAVARSTQIGRVNSWLRNHQHQGQGLRPAKVCNGQEVGNRPAE